MPAVGAGGRPGRLTAHQRAALDAIDGATEPLLLHGVTGGGKTEVYLRAAEAALERGRSVIVLVPEIALAPQTSHRFIDRLATRSRCCTRASAPASATTSGPACGPGRRASASGLGRPCSRPRRPGPDRDRRGARPLPTSRRATPLRRPRRRRAPGRTGAGLSCWPAAPRRGRRPCAATAGSSSPSGSTGALPPVELVGMLDAKGPCTSAPSTPSTTCAGGARRRSCSSTAAAGRTSSPAAPVAASGSAPTATSPSSSTARPARWPVATAAGASRCRPPARTAARRRWPGGARAPTARARARARGRAAARVRLDSDTADGGHGIAALLRLRAGRRRRAPRDADGRQGARLPRGDARRGRGRRRHSPLPRLPRRGADVRAGGAACRPQRPR